MNRAIVIPILLLFGGCGDDNSIMNTDGRPEGWEPGDLISRDTVNSEAMGSADSERIEFYGHREGDPSDRLYSIPADTPIENIVTVFRVGSHGAMTYSFDPDETVELVAEKAAKLSKLFPCRVTFADSAGLKLEFRRPITDADLDEFLRLFPAAEGFRPGAEGYIIEQEEGRHPFQRVQDENMFHFWWD